MSMLSVGEEEISTRGGKLLCTLSMILRKVHPLRRELGECCDIVIVLASNGRYRGAAQRVAIKKIFYGKSDERILETVERKAHYPLGWSRFSLGRNWNDSRYSKES
jgi:hypothetical protein